jgi:nucleotide-binding universal stress UspA family protein
MSILLIVRNVTTTVRQIQRFGYPSRQPAEVVAVLVNDGSCERVASIAVQEAVARGLPVRFLEVLSSHQDAEGRSTAEEAMFRAGLHALRGHSRTQSVFEVVRDHYGATVGARTRDAALIVVGLDGSERPDAHSLAERCLRHANCPVRTVPASE